MTFGRTRNPLSLTLVSSGAVKAASTGLAILVAVLLARLPGPAEFGLYSYVFAIISVAGILAQFGVPQLVKSETAQRELEGNRPRVKKVWQSSSRSSRAFRDAHSRRCGHRMGTVRRAVAILLSMSGHEREAALHTAIAAACNVILNFALIPPMRMQGAAIATLLTFVVLNLGLWNGARRRLEVNVLALAGDVRVRT